MDAASTRLPGSQIALRVAFGAAFLSLLLFGFFDTRSAAIALTWIVPALVVVGFVLRYAQPLNETEIGEVAVKRRMKAVEAYFSFSTAQLRPDLNFKKAMPPSGGFFDFDVSLALFPAAAAALLKSKKHEWVIVGFEKGMRIRRAWMNKGPDRSRVWPFITYDQIASDARRSGYATVICLHNHPNGGLDPSEQDFISARAKEAILSQVGVNVVEFICAGGHYRKYHRFVTPSFLPTAGFLPAVAGKNGKSRIGNLALHAERIFSAGEP
ncbi:MAG TPA: JAB domain-containing protein [Opitutaceae bacterium]|jgi:hypothetical protein